MGLFDKIKNLFLEDEEENEEVVLEEENKSVYEEPKDVLPKVMRDTIEEEKKQQKEEEVPQRKFNFPIDFDENEMPSRVNSNLNNVRSANSNVKPATNSINTTNREVVKKTVELYPKKEEVKFKQKFKPTPVISPVYGVLDKNYKKEEVREKSEEHFEMRRPSKKVDFETVRKKAFGNLSDEIKDNLMCENCELYKEAKRISEISKDDLLYDMLVDETKEEVTIEKAYDNYEDFGVAYEPKKSFANIKDELELDEEKDLDLTDELDVKLDDEFEKTKFDEIEEDNLEDEEEVVIPSREEKRKEKKVDDDFFQLIDSMYKERVDD